MPLAFRDIFILHGSTSQRHPATHYRYHPALHPSFRPPHPRRRPFFTAVAATPQVREIQASGLLLLGWAARGKGGSEGASGWDSLPEDLVKRCLDIVATAEKLHSMDVAIKSHAGWAKHHLQRVESRKDGRGAIVEHRTTSSEEDAWPRSPP